MEILEREEADEGELLVVNFGPQHPATHGTLRSVFYVDGEQIVKAVPDLGYLHTGFEKLAEHMTYTQWIATTDRMNYISAICNNVGYIQAVEEMLDVEVPLRAQYLRVILAELSRISEHILYIGLLGMDCGAFTVMLWAFREREKVYDIIESCCGSRLTTTYTRIGGVMRDAPPSFKDAVKDFLRNFPQTYEEILAMLHKNRIFQNRLRDVGVLTKEEAIDYGVTGPILRASGVEYDVRKARPYLIYPELDFDIPTVENGDCYARYWQRALEIKESLRIVEQALEKLPEGPYENPDYKYGLPMKNDVYTDMESLIHHFKHIMPGHDRLTPEFGEEIYSATEAPNGELGFYIVGTGTSVPYRIRIHPPSFVNYQVFPKLVEGGLLADAIPCLASLWIIAGELDR
ncbi:MAG: NADH dehydrogenase (quinone) subunit D [Planctomycetota bacterium]|nr:MAG: NADH dehydrogenase (quinone) subunit D [Planctomycetota bacterium]